MIKVKVNNEYKDVVKIFCGGTLQKEIIKVWSGEAQEYVYESSVEYTGTLPITINADGNALLDYHIYGADGGVGEPTESGEPTGYKLPMVTVDQLFDKNTNWCDDVYKDDSGNERTQGRASYTEKYMPCRGNQTLRIDHADGNAYVSFRLYFYDSQKQWIRRTNGYTGNDISLTIVPPANAAYFQVQYEYRNTYYNINTLMIYTTSTDTPVYIGENQLDVGEYVSYGEQKIYRDVSGTLTPTDPPVPLPEIPTIKGETVIDYDGDPKPSSMYIKYRR